MNKIVSICRRVWYRIYWMREFNRMMKGRKMKGGPELRGLFQEKGPVTREEIEGAIRSGGAVIYYIKWSDQARYFVYPRGAKLKRYKCRVKFLPPEVKE